MGEKFSIKGYHHALFSMFASGCSNITIKVNSTQNSVTTLLVNIRLDGFAIVCNCFICSVDIWLFLLPIELHVRQGQRLSIEWNGSWKQQEKSNMMPPCSRIFLKLGYSKLTKISLSNVRMGNSYCMDWRSTAEMEGIAIANFPAVASVNFACPNNSWAQ